MSYEDEDLSRYSGKPVECFLFRQGEREWKITGADEDITIVGVGTFARATISCGDVEHTNEDGNGGLQVYMPAAHEIPLLLQQGRPNQPVRLIVYVAHRSVLNDPLVFWRGRITAVNIANLQATLTGRSVVQIIKNAVNPMGISILCPRVLYSSGCGVSQATFTDTATLSAVSTRTLTSSTFAARADGWYVGGKVYGASGVPLFIVAHVGNTITTQVAHGITSGEIVRATAGCDRKHTTCRLKFGNLVNSLAFPWLPLKNPYTQRVF